MSLAESRFAALIRWRGGQPAEAPARRLSDYELDRIARDSATDAADLARLSLPNRALVSSLATEMAEVLAAASRDEMPAVETPTTGPASDSGEQIDVTRFAPLDLSRPLDTNRAGPITHNAVSGGVQLQWSQPPGAQHVTYRVVSSEYSPPPSPERGLLVAAVSSPEIVDGRAFQQAVRYYRVWANTGASREDAVAAQPVLVAEGAIVSPVQEARVEERDGQVIGRWNVPPGADRVDVYRHAPGAPFSPANLLRPRRPDDRQEEGFVDRNAQPGALCEYSIYVRATVADESGTSQLSAPVTFAIQLPANPEAVTDLRAVDRLEGQQSVFDLAWTRPPHGRVDVYLTETPPERGLELRPLAAASLATTVLTGHALINHPATRLGNVMFIEGVAWPESWYRAYVTPVTVAGGLVQVGTACSFARLDLVRDAVVRERVDTQVVVFAWPAGAASVAAVITAPGQPLPANAERAQQISSQEYDRNGGMLLQLPGGPVDVHLVPRAWESGRVIEGEPVRVHHPGVTRLHYKFAQQQVERRRGLRRVWEPVGARSVYVLAEQALPQTVAFVLTHNPQRLPLSADDGTALAGETMPALTAGEHFVMTLPPNLPPGFVRVFAECADPSARLALLDPDVRMLRT
ncbi:MAG: hypothetical protein ACOYEV_09035 [Candidatus Nanopelagicales bacterium]